MPDLMQQCAKCILSLNPKIYTSSRDTRIPCANHLDPQTITHIPTITSPDMIADTYWPHDGIKVIRNTPTGSYTPTGSVGQGGHFAPPPLKKCPVSMRVNHFMVMVVTLQRRASIRTHSDSVIYEGNVPYLADGVWELFRSLLWRQNDDGARLLNRVLGF